GILPPAGGLVRLLPPGTGMMVRGGEPGPLTPESGAEFAFRSRYALEGQTHAAYVVHPPCAGGNRGAVYWERTEAIPERATLDFYTGRPPGTGDGGDGVVFSVEVVGTAAEPATRTEDEKRLRAGEPSDMDVIFREAPGNAEWTHHTASLARWAGRTVRLRFNVDCGPGDDAHVDTAAWGDARIVTPENRDVAPGPMAWGESWLSERSFTSTFYFGQVRPGKAGLELLVESGEPVWIERLTVHGAPDVMAREFDGGLVLANPSPRPFTFRLDELIPGGRFHRLQGSANQDPATNNGAVVGPRLTLGPADALFLVRDQGSEDLGDK
ncbi:MAG: hypothetical protein M1457_03890, partial [bacterium]|nr:hypothetical protein [bacterium]